MPILEKSMVFTYDTLNIFTDASISGNISAPGFIAYLGQEKIAYDVKHLTFSTNNEGEAYAIKMALEYAARMKMCSDVKYINIYSDSIITVRGLREWIYSWVQNIYNGIMYSSSGKPVANQAILLSCIIIILYYNLNVNFYHVNGHKNYENPKHVIKFMNTFYTVNNIRLDKEFSKFMMQCNDEIDNFTRVSLYQTNPTNNIQQINYIQDTLFKPIHADRIDFDKYFELLEKE